MSLLVDGSIVSRNTTRLCLMLPLCTIMGVLIVVSVGMLPLFPLSPPVSAAPYVSPDGWEWQNPLPDGRYLRGIWGSSSADVFVVGGRGMILHNDGSLWSEMDSGTTHGLWGVWGSSASDAFAVGEMGIILHYDGNIWSEMSGGTTNWFNDIWGSSSSDVFAVGSEGTILHYGQQDGEAGGGTESSDSGISVWVWVGIALGATLIGVVVLILMRRRSTAL